MLTFTTIIKKFGEKGEKTGWTYVDIPADIAGELKPGWRRSFRVMGKIDDYKLQGIALIPVGGGNFIMGVNAVIRKGIGKRKGAMVKISLEEDTRPFIINNDLLECLADEPEGMTYFKSLPPAHQHYFSKWIDAAKTDATKTKRIAASVNAMLKKMDYGQMLREMQAMGK